MHKDWEELIPYYVAGALSRPEAAHLESHLARCPECRRSVEEWRAVASVVRAQAAAQLRDLPPLSARVMHVATRQAGDRRAPYQRQPLPRRSAQPSRLRSTSITLIAAVFTVIVFGGLLTLMVLRGVIPQPGAESAVLLPTATPTATEAPLITPTDAQLAAPTTPDTATPAPEIIVIEPSATPDPIATQPTTITNPPTQALIFNTPVPTKVQPTRIPPTRVPPTSAPPPTATDDPVTAFSLLAPEATGCLLHAATASPVSVYAGAGTQYALIGSATQSDDLIALAVSVDGWYQAQTPSGLAGWVRADQVYTSGSCDALPVVSAPQPSEPPPTATAYSGVTVAVVNLDSVNLRSGPGTIYPVMDVVYSGERLPVTARATMADGVWYLVQRGGGLWVSASVVQLAPADAFIPLAATVPPSPTPTATVIPFMSTLTPSPGAASGDTPQSSP